LERKRSKRKRERERERETKYGRWVFRCERRQRSQRYRAKTIRVLRGTCGAGDPRRRPLLADYSWQWDKTREGLVPVVLSNSWKTANCVNTNDEITGKSRFRVREVKGLSFARRTRARARALAACPEVVHHINISYAITPFVYAFTYLVWRGISYLYKNIIAVLYVSNVMSRR